MLVCSFCLLLTNIEVLCWLATVIMKIFQIIFYLDLPKVPQQIAQQTTRHINSTHQHSICNQAIPINQDSLANSTFALGSESNSNELR